MSSSSYQRLPLDDPLSPTNYPPPLWRIHTKNRTLRSCSLHFRQAAFLIATALASFSILAFYRLHDTPYSLDSHDLDIPSAADQLSDSLPTLDSHNIPHHHPHIPSHSTSTSPAPSPTPTPAVFSLIMWSRSSAVEGAISIKSAMMYSSTPLEFHIICDNDAQEYLQNRLSLVHHPQHNVLVRFYRISQESMLARVLREGALSTDHAAGLPGLMKLFIHEILPPSVERSIFIDTDAFFISDPAQVWAHLTSLQPGIAVSLPYHSNIGNPEWHYADRICSCVMLLNLGRLRELRLMDSEYYRADPEAMRLPALGTAAFEAMYGKPVPDGDGGRMKYDDVKLGDQGYWWAIVDHSPEIFDHMPFDWEVSSCLMDMYYSGLGDDDMDEETSKSLQVHTDDTADADRAVLPKLLHFNCLDGFSSYFEWSGWSDPDDGLNRRWGPAVRYHTGYKWIWLNQPASNNTLTMETLHDIKFADELYAESRAAQPAEP